MIEEGAAGPPAPQGKAKLGFSSPHFQTPRPICNERRLAKRHKAAPSSVGLYPNPARHKLKLLDAHVFGQLPRGLNFHNFQTRKGELDKE